MDEAGSRRTPSFRTANGTVSAGVIGEFVHEDGDPGFHVTSGPSLDTIVNEHRANEGLWHKPDSPMEHSLQSELRRLHTAIDERTPHASAESDDDRDSGY